MTQFNVGDTVDRHDLVTIHGKPVHLPDPEHLVHLQFSRYAGCPVCNLHMRDVAARHEEILAAGIREVVVFYSDAETMLGVQGSLPFATIADPEKELYAEFGVGTMRYTGALKPRTWRAALRGLANAPSLRGIGSKGRSALTARTSAGSDAGFRATAVTSCPAAMAWPTRWRPMPPVAAKIVSFICLSVPLA